jgi:hypothetical protein
VADFLRISDVVSEFPNPARVPVREIMDRFRTNRRVASQARALAIDFVTMQHYQRTLGLSRTEAEHLSSLVRPDHTRNGVKKGQETFANGRGRRGGNR